METTKCAPLELYPTVKSYRDSTIHSQSHLIALFPLDNEAMIEKQPNMPLSYIRKHVLYGYFSLSIHFSLNMKHMINARCLANPNFDLQPFVS